MKPVPRRLNAEEHQAIMDVCCSKVYQDLNPYKIHVLLLEIKIDMASISMFYRVLHDRDLVHFRGNTRNSTASHRPPERAATGPNRVWAWDITYLKSTVSRIYYYLYTIIYIWSRKIVGWHVDDRESYEVAEHLFRNLLAKYSLTSAYLHLDNGKPMKASTMIMAFYKLGIVPPYSRPRVSNDNAFIQSFFKTLKYMRSYPKFFSLIDDARCWVADFLDLYNDKHLHSAIGYVTPNQKHSGFASQIIDAATRSSCMPTRQRGIGGHQSLLHYPTRKS